jgi:hypothetical protein
VANLPGIRFYELEKNIGRSRIRNRLAEMAIYPALLFMDCDSEVASEDYIQKYLPYTDQEIVVCGGNIYQSDPPDDPEYLLRWLYGIRREQKPYPLRNINPYRSFMTNNFLIAKSVFLQIKFDETIIKYGHEDTLFGLELKKNGIQVKHINNPLYHIGLEVAMEFLRKTSAAIENLLILLDQGKIKKEDIRDIRILRAYGIISRYHMVSIYLFFYNFISNLVMRNLLGSNPGMFSFELYKLSIISGLIKKNNKNYSLH